jgi:hypothetical protein
MNNPKQVHDNFRVVSEADAVLRKGLAPSHHHHHPHTHARPAAASAAGGEEGAMDGEDDDEQPLPQAPSLAADEGEEDTAASLAAYIETVDRVQDAMRFLRRNARMRSADVALRQLELKQHKLLGDMREEVHRVLATRSRCALQLAPVVGEAVDYQASDPIPPSAARRVRALVDSLLRAGDSRWGEQAYVKARQAKVDGALKPFLERQQQILLLAGGKGGNTHNEAAAAVAAALDRERALSSALGGGDELGGTTSAVGGGLGGTRGGSVAIMATSLRMGSMGGGVGPEGEWVRYLQFVRELVKGA